MNKLGILREKINTIDDEIAVMIKKRFAVVREIGELKKSLGIAVEDTSREKLVIDNFTADFSDEIEKNAAKNIILAIIDNSKTLQK